MRTLYHFTHSPFARRVRLALAHKGLDVELREGRDNPAWLVEARRLVPLKTLPVLVDGAHVLGDSTAITHWLDTEYPQLPRIWLASGRDALVTLEVTTLVDVALSHIVDVGTHYYPLRAHPAWEGVKSEMLGRAQRALDALAQRVHALDRPTIASLGWSAADMWLYTAAAWIEGMPARVSSSQNIAQILEVGGWQLPDAVRNWAQMHRNRPDVRALDS
jgi:glutathione S-transferase